MLLPMVNDRFSSAWIGAGCRLIRRFWDAGRRMIMRIAAGVFPDIPLTLAVRALTIPGQGFRQFGRSCRGCRRDRPCNVPSKLRRAMPRWKPAR
jgi:hypothetical protein